MKWIEKLIGRIHINHTSSNIIQEVQQHQRIGSQFYIVIVVVGLFCSSQYYLLSHYTHQQQAATSMINIMGKQRMLAQKITSLAAIYHQTKVIDGSAIDHNLHQTINEFSHNHAMLANNQKSNNNHFYSEALHRLYFEEPIALNDEVEIFVSDATKLADSLPSNAQTLHHLEALRTQSNGRLSNGLEAAVKQLEQDTSTRLTTLHHISEAVMLASIISLALLAIFIFHPAIRSIRDTLGLMYLMRRVAIAANQSHLIDDGLNTAISAICEYTGWQIGHAYIYSEDTKALVSMDIWSFSNAEKYQEFKKTSDELQFAPGQGFMGEVYKDATPMWILDVADSSIYLRKEVAQRAGIKAAFAFPITVGRKAVAVMEFYSTEARIPDETLLGMMGSIGNQLGQVIERSRAQERAQLLETMIISANDAVVITKADLQQPGPEIVYTNPAFTEITGYQPEEIIGKSPRILQGEETDRETLTQLRQQLSDGLPFRGELLNYSKDNTPYWVSVSIMPIRNSQGVITHFASMQKDITERKASEKQLDDTMRQLRRANLKAEAVARDLEESLKLAEEANRAKSDFLANMSHELRTPMNGVLGMAHLLSETTLNDEQQEFINTINGSAETLLMLLNDILDFSKIEAGALTLESIAFHLPDLLQETTNLLKPQASRKNISLHLEIDDTVPNYIWGDSGRIRQMITNLMGNAIKFTQNGYVRLAASVQADDFPMLHITVQDTGIGIPHDKLSQIFDKFTQADTSVTRKYGGTGLGLAITRQLAQMMGGEVGVESALGKGSTFWISIPMEEAAASDVLEQNLSTKFSDASQSVVIPAEKARILLVEDYPVNQVFALKLLKKFGFTTIDLAENGQQAIQFFEQNQYDAIFMDCQMPEMDGYQTTESIRILEQHNETHTPIIAMTANAMIGDREKCLQSGMDDYISKPLKTERLQHILAQYFSIQIASSQPHTETPTTQKIPAVDMHHLSTFTNDDPNEERELMTMFMEQAQGVVIKLDNALVSENINDWKSLSHLLKGSAGNFGAMPLHHLAKHAEADADMTSEKKRMILSQIRDELHRVQEFCHQKMAV